uniref:Rho GTPase-activating protein 26 n=1 Tax=Romanomermis culicivorax TaxID=13658 RepID=A0A915HI90_ROMCU
MISIKNLKLIQQDEKKKFEKSSVKFYQSLEKHLHLSTVRRTDFKEADAALEMEQRHFYQASLDYVFVLQSVQELMKIDFVETISSFLYSWFTFYHVGHVLHEDFKPYLDNVQKRVQKAKDSFLATQQETEELKGNDALTLQALSEDDRKVWLDALDGKEPVYSPSSGPPKNYETTLNDIGFDFIKLCLTAIEDKGLSEQGLYRNCGVTSKVQRLLQIGIDRKQFEKLNLDDDREWEIKTITSSIKTFFSQFVNAAKLDNQQERLEHIHYYVHKLPSDHFKMLKLLVDHLRIVSENSHDNFMTIANLAVCFGPTLMRPKEETVASMMDIKFCNIVVEVLIENNDQIFCSQPVGVCTPKPPKPAHSISISEENGSNLSLAQSASVSGYSPSNRSDSHESIGFSGNTGVSNPTYATTIHSKLRPTTVYNSTGELRPNDRSSYDSLTSANSSHAPKSPSPNLSQNCKIKKKSTRIRRVKTLYECIAEHESELSFLPGQILTNVYPSKEPGWLMGTLNGKTGMVPENYVENLP